MSVRPLDLQVNMNSLIETSRDQASRQAIVSQEQRAMDAHIISDATHGQHKVNKSSEAAQFEKLEDTERHFGNKTEAETEQQFSEDGKEYREKPADESKEKKSEKLSNHIIDFLV